MAVLPIKIYPDPVLRESCNSVEAVDAAVRKLADNMAFTMYASGGIGLAASQVGVLQRLAVVDVSSSQGERIDFINPEIVWTEGKVPSEEGCLSIPDYRDTIQRSEHIVVQAKDLNGKEFELKASGILAICIQHEVDHLNGILFIDHLSRLKKEMFKKWLRRQTTEND